MSTITIDLRDLHSIASLINIASKPNSGTPVLEQVRCTLFSDGMLVAVATDRYAIVSASYELDYAGDTIEFGISHGLAKFITGIKLPRTGRLYAELNFHDDSITMRLAGQTFTAGNVAGNYPPVAEMVAKWQHAEQAMPVTLSLTLLSRLTKVVDRMGKKVENWSVELGASDNPNKPAPIRLLADGFSAIQQPRLAR